MHRYLITFTSRAYGCSETSAVMTVEVEAESAVKAEMLLDDDYDRVHLLELKEIL